MSSTAIFDNDDLRHMARALQLAQQGLYTTTPNPRVGCVLVKHGHVIAEAAHLRAGHGHAEALALQQAGAAAVGSTAYVTLEPCSHHGRTPPCAQALITAGVSRVVAAMQDPNPLVAGQGLAALRAADIEVSCGFLQAEAEALNPGFISRMTRQRPFLRSKIAASLDGRTALANGQSQWITSAAARADVQHWRARSCAILTGVDTVLHDDPQMTVRTLEIGRQPLRVVVDGQLRIRPNASILQGSATLLVYARDPSNKAASLQLPGVELLQLAGEDGHVSLPLLLQALAQRGINEVLVEAGQTLNGALQQQQLIDEYLLYYAPVLMGSGARGMFAMPDLTDMQQGVALDIVELTMLTPDIRIRAVPRPAS